MWHKKGIKPSFTARLFSLLLPVFILNLCILVPTPRTKQEATYSYTRKGPSTKRGNKFLLEVAIDRLVGCTTDLPDNTGSGLLEELNEVKEHWHHDVAVKINLFGAHYIENIHGDLSDSLFRLFEDTRFSPPPEYVA